MHASPPLPLLLEPPLAQDPTRGSLAAAQLSALPLGLAPGLQLKVLI